MIHTHDDGLGQREFYSKGVLIDKPIQRVDTATGEVTHSEWGTFGPGNPSPKTVKVFEDVTVKFE